MADWEDDAVNHLNNWNKTAKLDPAQKNQLVRDINTWADGITDPEMNVFPSPNGQGSFTASADNQTVRDVDYEN